MAKQRDDASDGAQKPDTADAGAEVTPTDIIQENVDADSVTHALQTLGTDTELPPGGDLAIDNEVLAAVRDADAVTGIEHALDQLTHEIDLFDISVVDFGSDSAES